MGFEGFKGALYLFVVYFCICFGCSWRLYYSYDTPSGNAFERSEMDKMVLLQYNGIILRACMLMFVCVLVWPLFKFPRISNLALQA